MTFDALARLGSSPHVRGAHRIQGRGRHLAGIIPACAGSTGELVTTINAIGDHPRMCGEHKVRVFAALAAAGSSPHVRGAQNMPEFIVHVSGIIPACAGSTRSPTPSTAPTRDHPRMCGEHSESNDKAPCCSGSSPHVRGARSAGTHHGRRIGIIPACAGSTFQVL